VLQKDFEYQSEENFFEITSQWGILIQKPAPSDSMLPAIGAAGQFKQKLGGVIHRQPPPPFT
jgi:hypothetical protein